MGILRKTKEFLRLNRNYSVLSRLSPGRQRLLLNMVVPRPAVNPKPRKAVAGIVIVMAAMFLGASMSESQALVPSKNVAVAIAVSTKVLEAQMPELPKKRAEVIVKSAYEAAKVSPSLGPRGLAALRWQAIAFGESSMNPKQVTRNTNGSLDHGIVQVNSIHLKKPRTPGQSTWSLFCRQYGFKKSLKNLENIRVNMLFGAYIQEMHAREGGSWSYKWASKKQPQQVAFYRRLVKGVRSGLTKAGIDYKTLEPLPTLASR